MHRFMLDGQHSTLFEGIWFTHGPVVICDDNDHTQTFHSMPALRDAYPHLELRWLDNAEEYWDAEDLAVRSALLGWTFTGPEYTLPGTDTNTN